MCARKQKAQAGAVLVEAAFTLLLLFVFLLGIIEAGRFLNVQEVITNAAREGARQGVVPLTQTSTLLTATEIENNVKTFLSAANIDTSTANVDVQCVQADGSACAGGSTETDYTQVTVT